MVWQHSLFSQIFHHNHIQSRGVYGLCVCSLRTCEIFCTASKYAEAVMHILYYTKLNKYAINKLESLLLFRCCCCCHFSLISFSLHSSLADLPKYTHRYVYCVLCCALSVTHTHTYSQSSSSVYRVPSCCALLLVDVVLQF